MLKLTLLSNFLRFIVVQSRIPLKATIAVVTKVNLSVENYGLLIGVGDTHDTQNGRLL